MGFNGELVRGEVYQLVPSERIANDFNWDLYFDLTERARYVRHENLKDEMAREWETFYAWEGMSIVGSESGRVKEDLVRLRVPTKSIADINSNQVTVDGQLITKRICSGDDIADIHSVPDEGSTFTVRMWIREMEGMEILDGFVDKWRRRAEQAEF